MKRGWGPLVCGWVFVASVALFAREASAQSKVEVAQVSGQLLVEAGPKGWTILAEKAVVPFEKTILSLPKSKLIANGVSVELLADVGHRGPLPILETGLILHESNDVDLDLNLERGLVIFTHTKAQGEAKVRLRLPGTKWTLTLQEPGTRVGVEIFGRQPPGAYRREKGSDHPTIELYGLVLKGQIFLETENEGFRMTAPPGTARFHWDSLEKHVSGQRLEKVPTSLLQFFLDTVDPEFQKLCASAHKIEGGQLTASLAKLAASEDKSDRLVGVTLAGAVDELPLVLKTLRESSHGDVREQAILVLRQWLGRKDGQVHRFADLLKDQGKMTEVQVQNALHLVLGFDREERKQPETLGLLVEYLQHPNQAVRELARWHLVRIVPEGKDFGFDAGAGEEPRRKAVERWQVLLSKIK